MRNSDSPALQRIDAAYSLPFLSACAATLREQGLLSELEADALRISLKERHRQLGEDEASLFSDLVSESAPLIHLLEARCGTAGLSQLFLAWTAARVLERSTQALEQWASSLLKKAELMFNQEFYIFQGAQCERRTLFSFYLVDTAEQLHEAAQSLLEYGKQLQFATPHSSRASEAGKAWEISLSQHLGFHYEQTESAGLERLLEIVKKFTLQLEILGDKLQSLSEQFAHNLDHLQAIDQWQLLLEDWKSQLSQLKTLDLLHTGSLERMEKKRLRLLSSLLNFNDLLGQQEEVSLDILKISRLRASRLLLWPQVEKRELLIDMVVQGVPLATAEQAVQTLEDYCRQHGVAPHQLLASELHRVHPQLHEGILLILQNLSKGRHLGADALQEKQTILKRKDKLMQALSGPILASLLALFFNSCGVKTAPRSEVLDLRPSVPYHAEQSVRPPTKATALPKKN